MPAKKPPRREPPHKSPLKLVPTKTELAQVGAGALNVIAFKSYREIPACRFTLKTDTARQAYDSVVRAKFDAGKLTLNILETASSYAKQVDAIELAALAGKTDRSSWYIQLDRLRNRLDLDEERGVIAASANAPVNRFARVGFSARRR